MTVDATSADAVRPLLLQQVVKSLLDTTENKDNPFAALLTNALTDAESK